MLDRFFRIACIAMFFHSSPAAAQYDFWPAYDASQAELSVVLDRMELNLIEMEAISMNLDDLESRIAGFRPRLEELNQRYSELNSYCQGEYPEPEYSQRVAYCDGMAAQLDTQKAQLEPERAALEQLSLDLQLRSTDQEAQWLDLAQEMQMGLSRLVIVCSQMSLAQQAEYCHIPPAPGVRTIPVVDQINAELRAGLGY